VIVAGWLCLRMRRWACAPPLTYVHTRSTGARAEGRRVLAQGCDAHPRQCIPILEACVGEGPAGRRPARHAGDPWHRCHNDHAEALKKTGCWAAVLEWTVVFNATTAPWSSHAFWGQVRGAAQEFFAENDCTCRLFRELYKDSPFRRARGPILAHRRLERSAQSLVLRRMWPVGSIIWKGLTPPRTLVCDAQG
jgi:hypothetical protein